MKKIWIAAGISTAVLALIACGNPAPKDPPFPTTPPAATTPATTSPTSPPTPDPTTPKAVSKEQQNATRSATSYLTGQTFSRKGLIDQLKYEGYSAKAATAAVDSLHVDWNAQAALHAEDYLNGQAFSRKSLIDQLKYDGFTDAQATYGATKAGL